MTAFAYRRAVDAFREDFLRRTLAAYRGNLLRASRAMGIHRNTLTRHLAALGISAGDYRRAA